MLTKSQVISSYEWGKRIIGRIFIWELDLYNL